MSNINRLDGGGPWRLELENDLDPGDWVEFDLDRMTFNGREGYFRPWLPMDEVMVKNLNGGNALEATYNSRFKAVIEANAADAYSDVQVRKIRLENIGGATITKDEVILQVSVHPYDADERAREEKQRSPLEKIARSVVGL